MKLHDTAQTIMLISLGVIALASIIAGTVLAGLGYSSAGAYAVASACVGVLGTLAAVRRNGHAREDEHE